MGITKVLVVRNMTFKCQVRRSIHGKYQDQRRPVDRRTESDSRLDPFFSLDGSPIGPLPCVSFRWDSHMLCCPVSDLECRLIHMTGFKFNSGVANCFSVTPHLSVIVS